MKRHLYFYFGLLFILTTCQAPQQSVSGLKTGAVSAKKDSTVYPVERKPYQQAYTMFHDLVHTKLEIKFDWAKKHVLGKATITLHPHFYPASNLVLNARGMDIHEVSLVTKNKAHQKLVYRYDSLKINITLDKEYTRAEDYTISIDYTAKPDELPNGGSNAISRDKGLYFINADGSEPDKPKEIWTQGETESNSAWFPTIEDPQQRMTQEIYLTVDTTYLTLSNGLLITSTDHRNGTKTDYWKQSLPAAPYLTMIAVGDFAVVKDHWRTIEVNYYVEHEYEKYAKMIFGNTPEMMEFFSEKLGVPYPWEKYSQVTVRDFVTGAMENTTAVVHREGMQQTYREYIDGNLESTISHELIHHWFGNLVTCESWSNIPLNEGFANYGEYLWFEYKLGRDDADYNNQQEQARSIQSLQRNDPDIIRFDYESREDMFDAISYAKAGRVLHMLRKYVGDDAFFASLKYYVDANKFSSVEIHDLRLAFEKTTGEDLNWFFNQWFLNHGKPSINIDYAWNDLTKQQTISIQQTQDMQKNPLYKIPLDVDIYSNGKVERKKIVIEKMKEDFVFPLSSKPDLVNVDAEKMLLCTKKDNKEKKDFIFQYYQAPLYLDRYEAVIKIGDGYEFNTPEAVMMNDALSDKFWNIRNTAIKNISVLAKMDKERILPKLVAIGLHDPRSQVRAAAIQSLAKNYPNDSLMYVYDNALNDSSYLVMKSAFKIIGDLDVKKGLALAKKLELEKDLNVTSAVATFYAQKGTEVNNDFLVAALAKSRGTARFGLITDYSQYLIRMEDPKILKPGIEGLADIGRKVTSRFTRQAAVNALDNISVELTNRISKGNKQLEEMRISNASQNQLLIEESKMVKIKLQRDELNETISDIKKNEKDPRLVKAYSGK